MKIFFIQFIPFVTDTNMHIFSYIPFIHSIIHTLYTLELFTHRGPSTFFKFCGYVLTQTYHKT